MITVKVELWLGMKEELGEDFNALSDLRSGLEVRVQEGTTVRDLFDQLADRYRVIAEKVFDRGKQRMFSNLVVTFNDRVISPHEFYDVVLQRDDKITVLPIYEGG